MKDFIVCTDSGCDLSIEVLTEHEIYPLPLLYELDGEVIDSFPNTIDCYKARPVIKKMPGWKCDIRGIKTFGELPQETRDYIDEIQRLIDCPITMISNGPGRDDIIRRNRRV